VMGALLALAAAGGCTDEARTDVAAQPAAGGRGIIPNTVHHVPRVTKLEPGILPRAPELLTGLFEPVGDPQPPESEPCEAWTLAGPLFATNSYRLSEAADNALRELADKLMASEGPFQAGGHADERSTTFPGGNERLSLLRAEAVQQALVDLGVPTVKFVPSVGHGARQPVDPGSHPEAYRVNRRVEMKRLCG